MELKEGRVEGLWSKLKEASERCMIKKGIKMKKGKMGKRKW